MEIFDTDQPVTPTATLGWYWVDEGKQATLESTGLAGAEKIIINQRARASYTQCYEGDVAIELTATSNGVRITGPKLFAPSKGVTASSVQLIMYGKVDLNA